MEMVYQPGLATREVGQVTENGLTASQKAQIKADQEAKETRVLADILAAHPTLTKEKALEYLKEAGF